MVEDDLPAVNSPDLSPHHLAAAIREAGQIQQSGDWTKALTLWEEIHANYPDTPVGFAGVATSLRVLKRFDEADVSYLAGLERFPNVEDLAVGYAQVAVGRGDWLAALKRWESATARFPKSPGAAAGLVTALATLRRIDEAEAALQVVREKFPENFDVMTAYARIAAMRRDWPEALKRSRPVLDQFRNFVIPHVLVGMALRELGHLDEADEVLATASVKFPDSLHVLVNFARVAAKRRDWPEALRRWDLVRERFGEVDEFVRGQGWVKSVMQIDTLDQKLTRSEADTPDDGIASVSDTEPTATHYGESQTSTSEADLAALPTNFESLGDDCEFGFVQRYAGAEPIGLLRWANIPTANLLQLLRTQFEGVGEPEFTHLFNESDGEIWVMDPRHDMRTHTFVYEADVPGSRKARFQRLMSTRFKFLKNQLLQDLKMASKIFVFKSKVSLSLDEVEAVFAAVTDYGPNWLLHVQSSSAETPPGTVRRISDRLLIGHVRTKGPLDHSGWRKICQLTIALREGSGVDAAPRQNYEADRLLATL